MTIGYSIVDSTTGTLLGLQAWDDQYAPLVHAGQKAVPFTAGGGNVLSGSFNAAGSSTGQAFQYSFNVSVWGSGVWNLRPEISYDAGATWAPIPADVMGNSIAWSAPASVIMYEHEAGCLFRMTAVSVGSGTVSYRISQ